MVWIDRARSAEQRWNGHFALQAVLGCECSVSHINYISETVLPGLHFDSLPVEQQADKFSDLR